MINRNKKAKRLMGQNRQVERGFTLIELMITLTVAAILTAIAVSAYQNSVRESRRTEAKTALMELATREQRLYATTNTYSTIPADLGYTGTQFPLTVGAGYYQVNVVVIPAAGMAPASFELTAIPIGSQVSDTQCAKFGLNSLGVQTAESSTGVNTLPTCW